MRHHHLFDIQQSFKHLDRIDAYLTLLELLHTMTFENKGNSICLNVNRLACALSGRRIDPGNDRDDCDELIPSFVWSNYELLFDGPRRI